jgi:GNAT superfamily N-acetyltransferase
MPAPFVRPATPADADAIGQVHVPRGGVLVVAAEGGEIAGFASFGPSRDRDTDPRVTGDVFAIYADPDAWRTGTGRALMGSAVAELARLGYADAILWVLDTNDRARRFYALAGCRWAGALVGSRLLAPFSRASWH